MTYINKKNEAIDPMNKLSCECCGALLEKWNRPTPAEGTDGLCAGCVHEMMQPEEPPYACHQCDADVAQPGLCSTCAYEHHHLQFYRQ